MKNYEPLTSFGEDVAAIYDDLSPRSDTEATVAFLEQLAGDGPALELAVGTGRVALPLAARGLRVDGIDLSPAKVAQLRAKPGGARHIFALTGLLAVSTGTAVARCAARRHTVAPTASATSNIVACSGRPPGRRRSQ